MMLSLAKYSRVCTLASSLTRGFVAIVVLPMILTAAALAQDQAPKLTAATAIAPPFVTKQGDELTGFSIDLWNEIAGRLKLETNYQVAPDVSALFDLMQAKTTDVVVAPIFLHERA